MSRLLEFNSVAELRAAAGAWDDLWRRSEAPHATSQAELVAQWLEQFAPGAVFRGLAVESDGRLVAALPLVGSRLKGLLEVGGSTSNPWSDGGSLLLDPQADQGAVMDLLAAGLKTLPWPLLWLDMVETDTPGWRAVLAAAQRCGLSYDTHERYRVGLVEIGHDWAGYKASWSRNHRDQMRKAARRLDRAGGAELGIHADVAPDEVEPLLRRGFEVEQQSWKGRAGTAVLSSPGMFDFFLRQARCLAERGHLLLAFLEHQGRTIAFEYGLVAKGVYFSLKIGYDDRFAGYSPGQLLAMYLIERFHHLPDMRRADFVGPLNAATARWITASYPVCRLVIATRPRGRWLLGAYKAVQPQLRKLRVLGARNRSEEEPQPYLPNEDRLPAEGGLSHSCRA